MRDDVIIIGGGASVSEGIELGLWEHIKGQEVWSLNYAFKSMPYLPTKQLWVDTTFFRNNTLALENLAKQGVECHVKKNDKYVFLNNLIQHETTRKPEEKDKTYIGGLGFCGMFALSLAVKGQYKRIFLLGYDFGTPNQGDTNTHFYQGKVDYISTGVGRPQVYLNTFTTPKKDVKEFDLYKDYPVYNVSMRSHISSFPKITYEEFFKLINPVKD
jgi:hypothetical protein